MIIFYTLLIIFVFAILWRMRLNLVGAATTFLACYLLFHGPALIAYTEFWSGELNFGLLQYLTNDIADASVVNTVYVAMSLCVLTTLFGIAAYDGMFTSRLARKGLLATSLSTKPFKIISNLNPIFSLAIFCEFSIIIMLSLQFMFVDSPTRLIDYYLSPLDDFAKVEIRRTASINFYPFQVLMSTLFPFIAFALIAEGIITKKKAVLFHMKLVTFLVFFAKLSTYNKSGPVIFLLSVFATYIYTKKGAISLGWSQFKILIAALLAVLLITAMVNSDSNIVILAFSTFDRFFMIPNEGIFEYFSVIPKHLPFGYGAGVSWLSPLFDRINGEDYMGTYWHVGAIVRGAYGSTSNSFFISDAWAEFSWLGVVVMSLLAGLSIRWYDYNTAKWGRGSIAYALLVSSYSAVYTLITTSLTTAFVTGGLLLTPIIAALALKQSYSSKKIENAPIT